MVFKEYIKGDELGFVPVFSDQERQRYPHVSKEKITCSIEFDTFSDWLSYGYSKKGLLEAFGLIFMSYCDSLEKFHHELKGGESSVKSL